MPSVPEPKFTDPRLTPPSQELRSIKNSTSQEHIKSESDPGQPQLKHQTESSQTPKDEQNYDFKSNQTKSEAVQESAPPIDDIESVNPSTLNVSLNSELSPEDHLNRISLRFKLFNSIFAFIVLFLIADALISLPMFQLRTLEFVGLKQVSHQELSLKLDLDHLSPSIIQPKLSIIEERILSHPWIKSAEASMTWRGHIQIKIIEHQATAIAVLDELKVVNSDGLPFASVLPSEVKELPLISGLPPEMFNHSQKEKLIGQYWLSQGIELARLIKSLDLDKQRKLSDIHISRTGRYEIMLDKIRISLGLDMLRERLIEVERILKQLDRKGVNAAYILLSDDLNRAIVKEIPITADDAESVE